MSASTITAPGRGWAGADRPPLSVRLLARVRAHGLDRRLADGAAPYASLLLARRAAVIVGRPVRVELADDLERILMLARTGEPRRLGAVPVRRHEVLVAAEPMRRLIGALRGPGPLAPRGVAIARRLIHDGTTPMYALAPRGAVARAVNDALAHADPRFRRG